MAVITTDKNYGLINLKIWFGSLAELSLEDNMHKHWLCQKLIERGFNLIYTPDKPDLFIYNSYDRRSRCYDNFRSSRKVLMQVENNYPFGDYDLCLSSDYYEDNKHARLASWSVYVNTDENLRKKLLSKDLTPRKQFCMFFVWNYDSMLRNDLFWELSDYKYIVSPGRVFNNKQYEFNSERFGDWRTTKYQILDLERPKFMIAYENTEYSGYTTEKLIDAMAYGAIPIYWGNPSVGNDFNEKSFINAHRFKTSYELIDYIKYVDKNDDVYEKIRNEPFNPNVNYLNLNHIIDRIIGIL